MKLIIGLALSTSLLGCMDPGSTSESGEQDTTATAYVHITDFEGVDIDGFFRLRDKLATEFNAICGDTFCEGDYANLTPMSLMCSVTSKVGNVHDCTWTFGGSLAVVNPTTSALSIDAPTYACHFSAKGTANKFITAMNAAPDAMHATLPGMSSSIYDTLGDCFQHPIGSTPVTIVQAPKTTYVEATDYYTSSAGQTAWATVKSNVKRGFDFVCGDTFCGSDYGDLQALDLVCSVTRSTGNVKACNWIFSGSFTDIGKGGALVENIKSFECPVTMHGTIGQLVAVINAPTTQNSSGFVDVIQRPLPGMTTSLYDALGGCLP